MTFGSGAFRIGRPEGRCIYESLSALATTAYTHTIPGDGPMLGWLVLRGNGERGNEQGLGRRAEVICKASKRRRHWQDRDGLGCQHSFHELVFFFFLLFKTGKRSYNGKRAAQ